MSIPSSGLGPGVRSFIHLLLFALDLYLRHKENIDEVLDSPARSSLAQLVSIVNDLKSINPPGPE